MTTTRETEQASRADPVDLLVGQRLRSLRKGAGVSQTALADKVGLTFQQVQKYEKGANRISASRLVHIGRALNVPPAYFFGDPDGLAEVAPKGAPTGRHALLMQGHEMIKLGRELVDVPAPARVLLLRAFSAMITAHKAALARQDVDE